MQTKEGDRSRQITKRLLPQFGRRAHTYPHDSPKRMHPYRRSSTEFPSRVDLPFKERRGAQHRPRLPATCNAEHRLQGVHTHSGQKNKATDVPPRPP
ncbi:TPA: hypothetical protein N0F65_006751 [Lagenidium giganteum]|uniref:Uncharacterized protein n=1 Tax=Lagenidium giganteum TaxID=4803 RepID=A0AAV2YZJ1_9STRA|nr:TPA: hypothetical protein N0F65_006751 [Lagenidium giganteum]